MIRPIATGLTAAFLLAAPAVAGAESLDERLAAASPDRGAKQFNKCKACHTAEEGGASRTGPNLWGVVGRAVASAEGFAYSTAMSAYGGHWEPERLDAFLAKPKAEIPGTKMSFAGFKKEGDRADLIAWLNRQGPAPLDFAAAAAPAADGTAETEAEPEFGVLVVADGVEEVFAYCTACHSEMIIAQQGQTREHWADVIEWMVDEQGLTPIEEPDLGKVLDYLATNYGPDRPNFPRY